MVNDEKRDISVGAWGRGGHPKAECLADDRAVVYRYKLVRGGVLDAMSACGRTVGEPVAEDVD